MARALQFPFRIDDRGFPATSGRAALIGEQLEQLLFTIPGERVNRSPEFGCGIQRLLFAGASKESAAAAEYVVSTAIRRHLGELIQLDAARVTVDETAMYIDILYTVLDSGEELAASFEQPLQSPP